MQFSPAPLIAAIAAAAIPKISEIEPQSLPGLVDLEMQGADELSVWLGRLIDQAFAALSSVPYSHAAYSECLHHLRIDGFGLLGTQWLLRRIGVGDAGPEFAACAWERLGNLHSRLGPTMGKRAVGKGFEQRRVLCFADFELHVHGKSLAGAVAFESGATAGVPGPLRATSLPVTPLTNRALCSEFQALCEIHARASREVAGVTDLSEAAGRVRLFVTSPFCASCVGALQQLQLLMPRVLVEATCGQEPDRQGR